MVRVEVHDFQSIQDGVVDIDGFSVVVGRSNIGKSALVRAIKASLTGAPADTYVRHGPDCQRLLKGSKSCKCFCSVRLQGPGLDLLWEKGDSVNRYVHNGTEHTVVGKGTPEFLGPGFAPIHIGGDTTATLLQVADQFRPLFILDRSGTAVADVLSDVAKLDQINDASRAVERDRRESAATRRVREKDLKELDDTLALYADLDAVLARVKAVEAGGEAVASLESKLKTLDRLTAASEAVTSAISALAPIGELELSSLAQVTEQSAKLKALTRWLDFIQVKSASVAALKGVADVSIPDLSRITAQAATRSRLESWTSQLVAMKAFFAKFKAAEAATVPDNSRLVSLHETYRTMSGWAAKMSGVETAAIQLQKATDSAEAEVAAVLAEFKALAVCPTCRQPIQISEHLHGGTAHA